MAGIIPYEPNVIEILQRLAANPYSYPPSAFLMSPSYAPQKRILFENLMRYYYPILLQLLSTIPYQDFVDPEGDPGGGAAAATSLVKTPAAIIVGGAAAALICNIPFDTPDIDLQLLSLNVPARYEGAELYDASGGLHPLYNSYMDFIFQHIVSRLPDIPVNLLFDDITPADAQGDSEVRHETRHEIVGGKFYVSKLVHIDFGMHTNRGRVINYSSKIIIMVKNRGYTERILEIKLPSEMRMADPEYQQANGNYVLSIKSLITDNLTVLNQRLVKIRNDISTYDDTIRNLANSPSAAFTTFCLAEEKRLRLSILTHKVRYKLNTGRIHNLLGVCEIIRQDKRKIKAFDVADSINDYIKMIEGKLQSELSKHMQTVNLLENVSSHPFTWGPRDKMNLFNVASSLLFPALALAAGPGPAAGLGGSRQKRRRSTRRSKKSRV